MLLLNDLTNSSLDELRNYIETNRLDLFHIGCGLPLYNPKRNYIQSINSLLSQKEKCVVFIADDSDDNRNISAEIQKHVGHFSNLIYLKNPSRNGQLKNTREVRDFFITHFPNIKYYFLGSDHDFWGKNFTKILSESLSKHPSAVIAIPNFKVVHHNPDIDYVETLSEEVSKFFIAEDFFKKGNYLNTELLTFDRKSRLRFVRKELSAGNMIYSLENIKTTQAFNYYEETLGPDRLYLIKVLSIGDVVRANSNLWLRVQFSSHSRKRQINNLFSNTSKPNWLFLRFPDWHHLTLIFSDNKIDVKYKTRIILYLFLKPIRKKISKIFKKKFLKIYKSLYRINS